MVSKKIVIIFVIIALILAVFSVMLSVVNSGERISTTTPSVILEDVGEGKVGIEIVPPVIEDKNG